MSVRPSIDPPVRWNDSHAVAAAAWRVRPMNVGDLVTVALEESRIYPFPWTIGNFSDSLKAGYDAWVFEDGAGLIGYGVMMWIPDEVHLLNLSVAAAHQQRGFGRAMLRWLRDEAGRGGARAMTLEVRPSNEPARQLYASEGFEQIGLRKRYYPSFNRSREDALVLRVPIEPGDPYGEVDR